MSPSTHKPVFGGQARRDLVHALARPGEPQRACEGCGLNLAVPPGMPHLPALGGTERPDLIHVSLGGGAGRCETCGWSLD